MAYLPSSVVADILSRLPVEPILRFRCVSKPWCALIDSRDFIQLHLKRSIESKNNLSLMIAEPLSTSLHYVSLHSLDAAVKIDHPLKCDGSNRIEVSGSCNGLVLLNTRDTGNAVIWNPSTKKHQTLPLTKSKISKHLMMSFGLGYDKFSDDYKVVRMKETLGDNNSPAASEVKVYSLKSNSWRTVEDCPFSLVLNMRGQGMFACGALHWVVSPEFKWETSDFLVAAFDLATEEYRLFPLPDFGKRKFHLTVEVLEGCLCISCSDYCRRCFEFWVMKDYGVRESWTKLFSHTKPTYGSQVPLAYSKYGSQLLLVQDDKKKLVWFDLNRNVSEKIEVHGLPNLFESVVCVQSLVPLSGRGSAIGEDQQKQDKKEKKTRKRRRGFLSEGFKLVL